MLVSKFFTALILNPFALFFTLAVISITSQSHQGQWLIDGSGSVVRDGFNECVHVSKGVKEAACGDKTAPALKVEAVQPAPVAAPKPQPVAAASEPEPNVEAKPKPAVVEETYTLAGDALFDTNQFTLSPAGKVALDQFLSHLNRSPNIRMTKISVVGHADSRGDDAYNQDLSEKRAKTVADYLIKMGIPFNFIKSSGRGERDPVASNQTVDGRAKNRRVEITLSGKQEKK